MIRSKILGMLEGTATFGFQSAHVVRESNIGPYGEAAVQSHVVRDVGFLLI